MLRCGRVEPRAHRGHDCRHRGGSPRARAAPPPSRCTTPCEIAADQTRAIAVDTVQHDLDRRRPTRIQLALEVRVDAQDPLDGVGAHQPFGLGLRPHLRRLEVARTLEPREQLAPRGAAVIEHDRDRHMLGVQRHAVAEQQDQDDRHHQRQRDAARVAQDLQHLLLQEAAQAHRRGPHATASA